MNTDEVRELITQADQHLDRLVVRGDNIFHVADARRLLKAAFDMLPPAQPSKKGEDAVG